MQTCISLIRYYLFVHRLASISHVNVMFTGLYLLYGVRPLLCVFYHCCVFSTIAVYLLPLLCVFYHCCVSSTIAVCFLPFCVVSIIVVQFLQISCGFWDYCVVPNMLCVASAVFFVVSNIFIASSFWEFVLFFLIFPQKIFSAFFM